MDFINIFNKKFEGIKNTKLWQFICKHPELFTIIGLLIAFYYIFFNDIGTYALMDVDETRYVSMARDMFHSKDFMTLYLNGEYFFEKPPLYFWGECLFFALFGKINEFTARFPVALYGTLTCFLVYLTGRRIVSRKFGVLSALILATSLEFVILAKFAILDIVLAMCTAFSVCFGLLTYFCSERSKKYLWWLFYMFSGLAVMAKGIPGFVVPFGTMFFTAIATKRFKELFKPIYWIPGLILFLLVVVPWHALMFKIHDPLFFKEYIIKHHIERFFTSDYVGREQPFYFFVVTLLWGFFPWIFSFIAAIVAKFRAIKIYAYETLTDEQKFLYLNVITFLWVMVFFSISSTKLITYLLPIYVPAAFITGYIWNHYGEFKKQLDISSYILGGIVLIAFIAGLCTPLYLPSQLYQDILTIKWFCIVVLFVVGILTLYFTRKNKPYALFAVLAGFILFVSAFATEEFFEVDYAFGQNDLIEFAKYAKENNYDIGAVDLERKYSLLYYGGKKVDYREDEQAQDMLKDSNKVVVILKKDLERVMNGADYEILKTGRRYHLIKGK